MAKLEQQWVAEPAVGRQDTSNAGRYSVGFATVAHCIDGRAATELTMVRTFERASKTLENPSLIPAGSWVVREPDDVIRNNSGLLEVSLSCTAPLACTVVLARPCWVY